MAERKLLNDAYVRTTRNRMTRDTMQKGLWLRVRKSGSRSFVVVYQHEGRTRWYTIGAYGAIGLSAARDIARDVRERAAAGEDPQQEKVDARLGDTLRAAHESYLKLKAKKENKSWRQANNLMQKHVLRKLGGRKLKDITHRDILRIYDDLHDRPVLANSVLAAASAVFTWFIKRRMISDNPCRGIERHKTKSKERFLSNDEIRAVWPLFNDLGLYRGSILKLVLLTAQRPGEVRSMRWEHVDLDARLWSMPGLPTQGWPGTKNKRDHEVPLSDPVLEILQDLDPQPSGHVFPSTRRGCISKFSIAAVYEAAGIPRFRPHDLRATAATKMDELPVSREHISLVLNHVEGGTTAGYIRHDKRQHRREALELWATELMAILENRGRTDQRADVVPLRTTVGSR